jgi:hypothetical protein
MGGLVLLAMAISYACAIRPTRDGWNANTSMSFLGFTNVVAGAPATNALFGFNDLPSSSTWRATEISRWDGTKWIPASGPALRFDPVFFNGPLRNFSYLGSVPVGSTSAPTRVVIGLGPVPGKGANLRNGILQLKPLRWLPTWFPWLWANGQPRYFMTNEFNKPPSDKDP